MQQSLTEVQSYAEYQARRGHRPVLMKRAQFAFVIALALLGIGCTWLSFYLSHRWLDSRPEVVIGPFLEFWPLPTLYSAVLVIIFFGNRMYQRRRAISHLDELFKIAIFNVLATLVTVALLTLGLRDFDYHMPFVLSAALIKVAALTVARTIHAQIQWKAK